MNILYVNNNSEGSNFMNTSYIKLNAKKYLVKCHFKCFLLSIMPYVIIVLLSVLNYYLYFMLKNMDFTFLYLKSSYAVYLRASLLTLSLCLSILLWRVETIFTHNYYYLKSRKGDITYFSSIKYLSSKKVCILLTTDILKIFLSVAWSALYFAPCFSVVATLYYCWNSDEFSRNIALTLIISAFILFLIGSFFLFVTLKRYSMCYPIAFETNEKDSLKILEKSIEIMNGKCLNYAFYNMSFWGWILSCFLVLPSIYVLPYKHMSKYSYYNFATRKKVQEETPQKPIVFYIQKRKEV